MGNTPLILAALAKAAIPSLKITRVGELGGSPEEKIVVVTTADGQNLDVRMPRTRAALTALELELRALAALTPAARERLPFAVSRLVGQANHPKGAAALVLEHVSGNSPDLNRLSANGTLAQTIGEALGAIHNLPLSVVTDAHLPEYSPADIALRNVNELDRIAGTGKVPPALLDRWQSALEDVSLFRYQPTVVHGSLDTDTVFSGTVDHAEVVTGVAHWSQLHIGDPAEDFAWIFGSARTDLIDAVLMYYNTSHPNQDETLRQRAQLYSELAVGRYLLSGVESNNDEIVEDMVAVLAELENDLNQFVLPPLGKVEAPIAPIFAASELAMDADGALEDANLDALDRDEESFAREVIVVGDEIEIESVAVTDATEPVEVVSVATAAIDVVAEGDDETQAETEEESESAETAPVDDKTRPIELPAKTDNELF
ncbi:MAG: hypothetical protein RLZ88_633 [Actinomycetota bacterium]|jgi:aminoglycoside phosphotransferase (APT) family kinase protein